MYIRSLYLLILATFILFLAVPNAFAISIDQFNGAQTLSADLKISSIANVSSAQIDILGSYRTIEVRLDSGDLITARVASSRYSHSQEAETTGFSKVVWDGDNSVSSVNYNGLDNLDLLQDGATAFQLYIVSFDFAFQGQAKIILTIYDSADPVGLTFSQAEFILDRAYQNEVVEIPFSTFTNTDPSRLARLTNVGAISLLIDGTNPALDLRLDYFKTNGNCVLVPVNGVVIDECGVCGGDGSSCRDCAGIPNGPIVPGSSCPTGELGVCATGILSSQCVCEPALNSSAEVCDALDNDCDGAIDEIESLEDLHLCYDCDIFDQFDRLRDLDGGAKEQEYIIKLGLNELRKYKKDKETKAYIKKAKILAHELQNRNWILSWSLPVTVIQCPGNANCETVSNAPVLEEYRKHSEELLQLALDVVKRLQTLGRKTQKITKSTRRRSEQTHQENMELLATVPIAQSEC